MTSSTSNVRECYVHVTLPGTTQPVTAGRFSLQVDRRGVPEGRFVYGRRYRAGWTTSCTRPTTAPARWGSA